MAAAVLPWPRAAQARTVRAAGLHGARLRTYVALVEAVGLAGASNVNPARAEEGGRRLEARYARTESRTRQEIEAVLDELERAANGSFGALGADERLSQLQRWQRDSGRAQLVRRAVELAALPFSPSADEFGPPVVSI